MLIKGGERYVGENAARERAQTAFRKRDGREFDVYSDDHDSVDEANEKAAEATTEGAGVFAWVMSYERSATSLPEVIAEGDDADEDGNSD